MGSAMAILRGLRGQGGVGVLSLDLLFGDTSIRVVNVCLLHAFYFVMEALFCFLLSLGFFSWIYLWFDILGFGTLRGSKVVLIFCK